MWFHVCQHDSSWFVILHVFRTRCPQKNGGWWSDWNASSRYHEGFMKHIQREFQVNYLWVNQTGLLDSCYNYYWISNLISWIHYNIYQTFYKAVWQVCLIFEYWDLLHKEDPSHWQLLVCHLHRWNFFSCCFVPTTSTVEYEGIHV